MKSITKLMIVDDDPCFLRYMKEVIGDACDLFLTMSGEEALNGFYQFQPHILLLDIVLPGIDGIEVCKRIRAPEVCSDAVIIMTSAMATEDDKDIGYRAGADHYLTKPFDHHQLFSLIEQYIPRETSIQFENPSHSLPETAYDITY